MRLARALVLEDGLVLVGVERRAVGLDPLEARLLEHRHELRADAHHAVAHLLGLGRVTAGQAAERAVERVEHREEVLDQPLGGALDERRLLAQHALAVVLEVGLDPAQRVDELVALARQLGQILLDRGLASATSSSSAA